MTLHFRLLTYTFCLTEQKTVAFWTFLCARNLIINITNKNIKCKNHEEEVVNSLSPFHSHSEPHYIKNVEGDFMWSKAVTHHLVLAENIYTFSRLTSPRQFSVRENSWELRINAKCQCDVFNAAASTSLEFVKTKKCSQTGTALKCM